MPKLVVRGPAVAELDIARGRKRVAVGVDRLGDGVEVRAERLGLDAAAAAALDLGLSAAGKLPGRCATTIGANTTGTAIEAATASATPVARQNRCTGARRIGGMNGKGTPG